jgi:peptide/nickel transport system substrate-binding protein
MAAAVYSYLICLDWGVTKGVHGYGDLAKDWEKSEDGLVYTFHLHEDVRWHDGEPLTSADVKYTYDTIIEKGYPMSGYLRDVKEIRTPDDYTVEIELNLPAASFIPLLAQASNWFGSILPKHLYEGTDWETGPCSTTPVGSGPFKFAEWVPDSHVVVEANDDYFRGRPKIDTLILQHVPDTNVAVAMFQAGEFPYLPNHYIPSFGEIDQMLKDPARREMVVETPSFYGRDLYINVTRPPLNDPKVREALAYGIDRDGINQTAFFGLWPTVQTFGIPSLGIHFNPDARFPDFDPERAKQLLDEAGYPEGSDGWRFALGVTNYNIADQALIAEVLVQQLRAIGIDATWQQFDAATWNERIGNRDFDLTVFHPRYGPDPDSFWEHYATDGPINWTGYSNPQVDELLELGKREANEEKRAEIYKEVQAILVEDMPQINLFQQARFSFVDPIWSGFPVQEEAFGKSISWFGYYAVQPPGGE